jgi:hypothetical protein
LPAAEAAELFFSCNNANSRSLILQHASQGNQQQADEMLLEFFCERVIRIFYGPARHNEMQLHDDWEIPGRKACSLDLKTTWQWCYDENANFPSLLTQLNASGTSSLHLLAIECPSSLSVLETQCCIKKSDLMLMDQHQRSVQELMNKHGFAIEAFLSMDKNNIKKAIANGCKPPKIWGDKGSYLHYFVNKFFMNWSLNFFGTTPIEKIKNAASYLKEIVKVTDPNGVDRYGNTPLHCLQNRELDDMIFLMIPLLEGGADPFKPNHLGVTAFDLVQPHQRDIKTLMLAYRRRF